MVSLVRSGLTLLSFSRPVTAFLSRNSKPSLRRTILATSGLFTLSSVLAQPTTSCTAKQMSSTDIETGYLNAANAYDLDVELMSQPGFSLEQLMELAGLAVAEAVYQVLPPTSENKPKILLICGPGNNGGDGLVAARHLVFFGYDCVIMYPKQVKKQHFINLVKQCEDVGVTFVDEFPTDIEGYNAIVDAIFGFSFKGEPREPFKTALEQMRDVQTKNPEFPILSVDVPSGWNVDEGDVAKTGFVPSVLISLTAPKESARSFPGRHFVGGRFLPPALAKKYGVKMPPYPGVSQVMEITKPKADAKDTSWEAEYAAYLLEKGAKEKEAEAAVSAASKADDQKEVSWEQQYNDYCVEKEARLAEEDAKKRAAEKESSS